LLGPYPNAEPSILAYQAFPLVSHYSLSPRLARSSGKPPAPTAAPTPADLQTHNPHLPMTSPALAAEEAAAPVAFVFLTGLDNALFSVRAP